VGSSSFDDALEMDRDGEEVALRGDGAIALVYAQILLVEALATAVRLLFATFNRAQ
jgi:hypothetical protein